MSGLQVFLLRLYLSESGLDIFVVSGGIRGINMSYLWKENMIDAPLKKSVFLPNSHNMYAGSGLVFCCCFLGFGVFLNFIFFCRKGVHTVSIGLSCVLCTFLGSL